MHIMPIAKILFTLIRYCEIMLHNCITADN